MKMKMNTKNNFQQFIFAFLLKRTVITFHQHIYSVEGGSRWIVHISCTNKGAKCSLDLLEWKKKEFSEKNAFELSSIYFIMLWVFCTMNFLELKFLFHWNELVDCLPLLSRVECLINYWLEAKHHNIDLESSFNRFKNWKLEI